MTWVRVRVRVRVYLGVVEDLVLNVLEAVLVASVLYGVFEEAFHVLGVTGGGSSHEEV